MNLLVGAVQALKMKLPSLNREMMYAISSKYQKKGYATKTSKGLINYLFKDFYHLGLDNIFLK